MDQGYKSHLEDMAEEFLKSHDKLYQSKKRKKLLEYSYLSGRQMRRRKGTEIPVTSLSKRQRSKCPNLCGEMMYGDEKG